MALFTCAVCTPETFALPRCLHSTDARASTTHVCAPSKVNAKAKGSKLSKNAQRLNVSLRNKTVVIVDMGDHDVLYVCSRTETVYLYYIHFQVSICKFKFTGGHLQSKKMLSVDVAGGHFKYFAGGDCTGSEQPQAIETISKEAMTANAGHLVTDRFTSLKKTTSSISITPSITTNSKQFRNAKS